MRQEAHRAGTRAEHAGTARLPSFLELQEAAIVVITQLSLFHELTEPRTVPPEVINVSPALPTMYTHIRTDSTPRSPLRSPDPIAENGHQLLTLGGAAEPAHPVVA